MPKPTLPLLLIIGAICIANVLSSEITYVQPDRFIRCSPEDDPCRINLVVSAMHTLNAYCLNDNATRGGSSIPVTVNQEGQFEFVYGENSPSDTCGNGTTSLFQPIVADGITQRNLLVVNDQLPGPTIIGYKNQRVLITVDNDLGKEAISIHWHGLHVNGSQFMDGVPFVTQCPIQPGDRFVYDFSLFPSGTYWYHSHQYDERSNGMYGALVVLDLEEETDTRYDFDLPEQHTIVLFEWFPVNSDEWIGASYPLADPANPSTPYIPTTAIDGSQTGGGFPPFIAGLMNFGCWRYTPDASTCTRVANTTLSFFNVTEGSRYRFRLVGSQVDFAYRFSISGHRLRVIATDGIGAAVPSSITDFVDFIIVHVAERYDFVLEANQAVDNYLMVAETLEDPEVLNQRGYCIKAHRVYGVLHYEGANDILPADFDDSYNPLTRCNPPEPQCFALNCPFQNYPSSYNIQCIGVVELQLDTTCLEPISDLSNTSINPSLFLNFAFPIGPSINGRAFTVPESPLLSQEDDIPPNMFCLPDDPPFNPLGSNNTVLRCINYYNTETDTIEFVYTNIGSGTTHPVHLHGHHYFVLNIGYPNYYPNGTIQSRNSDLACAKPNCTSKMVWSNDNIPPPSPCMDSNTCPLKDTVIVPVQGYVRVRFPRNNWGWWIMHCHIEPHLLEGMAMVINETSFEGNAVDIPNGFPTCGDFNPTAKKNDQEQTTLVPTVQSSVASSVSTTQVAETTASPETPQSDSLANPTDDNRLLIILFGAVSIALLTLLTVVVLIALVVCGRCMVKISHLLGSVSHFASEKPKESTTEGRAYAGKTSMEEAHSKAGKPEVEMHEL